MVRSQHWVARGVTTTLAYFAAEITYESLPAEVVGMLKRMLLDTLGTTLAANTLGDGCGELVTVARNAGGAAESTLIGFGDKVPALMAALVNGGMAHALNYDAVGAGHLGLMPVAPLAAAERAHADGRELLAALAAGCEITARITMAVRSRNEAALEGQLLGYFGAAAGAGRVMKLSAQQMESALGLALMQTAGARQVSVVGGEPPAKAIYGAFPNHGGMLAALLSELGLGAECDALEGRAGLYALYYGGDFDAEALVAGLGEKYLALNVNFKPWATSGIVNPFIEAALDLVQRHHPSPNDIQHVRVRGGTPARHWIEPPDERKRPANAAAAANSVFFAVAKALTNGAVTLSDFTPAGLIEPQTLEFADRMDHTIEPELGHSAIVELSLKNGERLTSRVDTPLGSPANPMSQAQIVAKFLDCAGYAAKPVPQANLERVVDLVAHLEDVPDVGQLAQLLSGA